MHFAIADRTFWDDNAVLSNSLLEELRFLRYNLSAFNNIRSGLLSRLFRMVGSSQAQI